MLSKSTETCMLSKSPRGTLLSSHWDEVCNPNHPKRSVLSKHQDHVCYQSHPEMCWPITNMRYDIQVTHMCAAQSPKQGMLSMLLRRRMLSKTTTKGLMSNHRDELCYISYKEEVRCWVTETRYAIHVTQTRRAIQGSQKCTVQFFCVTRIAYFVWVKKTCVIQSHRIVLFSHSDKVCYPPKRHLVTQMRYAIQVNQKKYAVQ